ncbi:MAG: hypothetical protein ACF8CQ_23775 [Rhodopirellula sp. JB044]|uniref:hypothetical protein n=1 Tax=Rhodopirellula sp. JB044 TaxID=3342844 RepID=UPI00370C0CDE
MWLIAIDEAGYGPKLGPLVVAASAWRCSQEGERADSSRCETSVDQMTPDPFRVLGEPVRVGRTTVRVDDSKQVFRGGILAPLHAAVSVAHHACGHNEVSLAERLPTLLPMDYQNLCEVAWLKDIGGRQGEPIEFAATSDTADAREQWSRCQWRLVDVAARVVDAATFNRFCNGDAEHSPRGNKSDLLGETSLRLASLLIDQVTASSQTADRQTVDAENDEPVELYFDRHGGRRYYTGVIQSVFGTEPVRVIHESKTQSVYATEYQGRSLRLHFTVKGDRFIPVALSSLHAKYLRELAMASFNAFFRAEVERTNADRKSASSGQESSASEFRPTAGYPVDADRFIETIRPTMQRLGIEDQQLIRSR